ncbi:MAG: hypothetical protein AAGA10_18705, partial [Bacteroidota bacterium]
MSDSIKHECGVGIIRLRKPLEYFQETYDTGLWGLNKLYLLMEKMRNRGQDGAGMACLKMNMKPGLPFHSRIRSVKPSPWTDVYHTVMTQLQDIRSQYPQEKYDSRFLKKHFPYAGEVYMGHLRYGTHGSNKLNACHPVVRTSNYINRNLALAGNFNLTNVDQLFQKLVELGQHPRYLTDTETMLERICHFLDNENDQLESKFRNDGFSNNEIVQLISNELDITAIMSRSAKLWDGGYVIGGVIGNGDAFVARDPSGIRPCYYYQNEEFAVAASERAAISTVFDLNPEEIFELAPGHVWLIKGATNEVSVTAFTPIQEKKSCSFERIYFSRGSDPEIYQERKALGHWVFDKVLEHLEHGLEQAVFSFIPNTAETSFLGMLEAAETHMNQLKAQKILQLKAPIDPDQLEEILALRPRSEKLVHKDVKMRTFIADDSSRDDLVSHVYDVTRGYIEPEKDTLVCIDDSIVRGTTLKKSILNILSKLEPYKILIVSSAPQIRYPDCYGIDMSKIHKLIAFQAAISLLEETGQTHIIEEVYQEIKAMEANRTMYYKNVVKAIYAPFTEDEVAAKITEILSPEHIPCKLEIIFQPLENLSKAIPDHLGDWYFSGDYPTPGGNRVVNQAFLNYYEGKNARAYQFGMV